MLQGTVQSPHVVGVHDSGHSAATVKRAAHGYEATREAAMAAFAKSWRRAVTIGPWQRVHANDPQWRQDLICGAALDEMRWVPYPDERKGGTRAFGA
jgi:hypothetical protein